MRRHKTRNTLLSSTLAVFAALALAGCDGFGSSAHAQSTVGYQPGPDVEEPTTTPTNPSPFNDPDAGVSPIDDEPDVSPEPDIEPADTDVDDDL